MDIFFYKRVISHSQEQECEIFCFKTASSFDQQKGRVVLVGAEYCVGPGVRVLKLGSKRVTTPLEEAASAPVCAHLTPRPSGSPLFITAAYICTVPSQRPCEVGRAESLTLFHR